MNKPLLALDIGLKRTGVALSESGLVAQPLGIIEAKPPHMTNVVEEVLNYLREYQVQTLLIGLPYTQDGDPTNQSLKVETVIEQIEQAVSDAQLPVQIERINEFHSTRDAKAFWPNLDDNIAAAATILQAYLDQHAA